MILRSPTWLIYSFAIGAPLSIGWVQSSLTMLFPLEQGGHVGIPLFQSAIAVSVAVGGKSAGLLTLLISLCWLTYFWVFDPSTAQSPALAIAQSLIFLLGALIIGGLISFLRDQRLTLAPTTQPPEDWFQLQPAIATEHNPLDIGLPQNEHLFQVIFDAEPECVKVVTPDGILQNINRAGLAIIEADSPDEILGRNIYSLIDPDHRAAFRHFTERIMRGYASTLEFELTSLKGSHRWLESHAVPLSMPNTAGTLILAITRDITDRKETEAALLRANLDLEQRVLERTTDLTIVNDRLLVALLEQRHAQSILKEQAQLLDLAHDTIMTLDLNWIITFWNRGAESMYGWSRAEAIGQESYTLLNSEFPQPIEYIKAVLFSTGYWEGEVVHTRQDRRSITVSSRWVLQKDEQGSPVKILEINNDITARKQAEVALQQYIHEVEDLYNNAPCGYHSLNEQGVIVRMNDTELNWLGYLREEVLNQKKFVDFLSPESQSLFHECFLQFKQTGWLNNVEFQLLKRDGSSRWISLNSTAIKNETGQFVMSRTTLFDITDRKYAEVALQQQTRQKQLLWTITQKIRQSLDLEIVLNAAVTEIRQLLNVDRSAVYRFNPNWSGDFIVESVAEGWIKLVDPGICYIWEDTYLQETQGGRFKNHETLVVNNIYLADLRPCHLQLLEQFQAKAYAIAPIFVGTSLWGLFAIYQNTNSHNWESWEVELLQQISSQLAIAIQQSELYSQLQVELQERKQAAAVLREAERRWRSLLDNVQLIVVGLDQIGRVNYVNPFFLSLTGYNHSEVLGQNWCEVFLPPVSQDLYHRVFDNLLTHNSYPYHKSSILTKSGEERFIAWNNTLLQDSKGNTIGIISIGEDITEQQKIEAMKNEFIGIVSHELRTPLTAIQMSLGLLKIGIYDQKPEKAQRMIEIALTDTNRLVNLVNDILDLERLESGRAVLERSACQANDLMQQAVDGVQAIATQQSITLKIQPTTAIAWAAADTIIQTLTNLLSNAIKFSPSHSLIQLRADRQGDSVLFQVQDQGRGIPSDKLEIIFGRFQQVDASDSREKGGTGLGLPICRSIIERHGGKIWAESTLGSGSTFFFTLPVPPNSLA